MVDSFFMEQLYRLLKPLANNRTIVLIWSLTILNFYYMFWALTTHATSAGLDTIPIVLDTLTYYTPDEGYELLTSLGNDGRDTYRLINYADFILPLLLFLSLALPNVAVGKGPAYIIAPLIYMISDYIENIAEKYVLEIYPKRNDSIMTLACYAGLIKMLSFGGSLLIFFVNGIGGIFRKKHQLEPGNKKRKVK